MPGPVFAVSRAHLAPAGDFRGVVHGVFARACTLDVDGTLVTLHDASAAHTPTSIRVAGSPTWSPRVRVGEHIVGRAGYLRVGDHVLDLRQLPVWTPGPPPEPAPVEAIHSLTQQVALMRRSHPTRDDTALAPRVAALVPALRSAAWARDRAVSRLIGFGPGLTPAGDDALVGMLAALHRGGGDPVSTAGLNDAVAGHLHRTTEVSAHYLRLAVAGKFSEPITDLVDALTAAAPADTVAARTRAALAVGASSGADALLGVLAGIDAVHPRIPEKVA